MVLLLIDVRRLFGLRRRVLSTPRRVFEKILKLFDVRVEFRLELLVEFRDKATRIDYPPPRQLLISTEAVFGRQAKAFACDFSNVLKVRIVHHLRPGG